MVTSLSAAEHAEIADGIAQAEQALGVDIRLVLAKSSSHYGAFVLIHMLVTAMIVGSITALVFPHIFAEFAIGLQIVITLLAMLALECRPFRQQLIPNAVMKKAAWRQARLAFADMKLKSMGGEPSLLFYCSELERYAEILVDARIAATVPAAVWQAILTDFKPHMRRQDIVSAFLHVIEASAAVLQPHFPRTETFTGSEDDFQEV